MLHSQASVNVEAWHEVGLARLRVLQTLGNESRAPLGQQQELLDMLPTGKFKMSEVPSAQNITYFLLKPLHCQVFSLPHTARFSSTAFVPSDLLSLKEFAFWLNGDTKLNLLCHQQSSDTLAPALLGLSLPRT